MGYVISLEDGFSADSGHEYRILTRTNLFAIVRSPFPSRYVVKAPFSIHGHTIAGMSGCILGSLMVPNNGKMFACINFDHTAISLRNCCSRL